MTQNPYQPPGAIVKDDVPEMPARPPQIALAIRLLWASLAVGIVSLLPGIRGEWWMDDTGAADAAPALAMLVVVTLIFAGIWVALVLLTARRRNWARWTLLAYMVFGWYMQVPELSSTIAKAPFAGAMDVFCVAVELSAAYLLFLSPGAAWFKARPAA